MRAAVTLGRFAGGLSRSLGVGDGVAIGGRVTLAADPRAFAKLVGSRPVVFVSATNGKTTTTRLLAAALRATGDVVTNSSGANMPAGIVTALARPGRVAADAPAVLEADESYLPSLLASSPKALLVAANLSRDQLDRVGEVAMVARRWRAAFSATDGLRAVANADDPHVVWATQVIGDVTWVSAGQRWTADSALCPACGAILRRRSDSGAPDWQCSCGFGRPEPSWHVDYAEGVVVGPYGRYPLTLQLPGAANQANAAFALVAAQRLGVRPEDALPALAKVASVGGRYQTVSLAGRRVRLLLGKNPAGWAETFAMLSPPPAPIVIAINARAADGKDPSWLWDVAFEQLAGRCVLATGERRHDLAVRLLYAGVDHVTVADPWTAGSWPAELAAAGTDTPVDAVGTYTAFRDLLRRGGGADDAR